MDSPILTDGHVSGEVTINGNTAKIEDLHFSVAASFNSNGIHETVVTVLKAIVVTQLDGSLELTQNFQPDFDNQFFVLSGIQKKSDPFIVALPAFFMHAIRGGIDVVAYAQKIHWFSLFL
jgi:hypothetical protein